MFDTFKDKSDFLLIIKENLHKSWSLIKLGRKSSSYWGATNGTNNQTFGLFI
jgi:hypothetical protein